MVYNIFMLLKTKTYAENGESAFCIADGASNKWQKM